MIRRRDILAAAVAAALAPLAARAHHGWRWATDEEFSLSGTVLSVRLGNPHGELRVDDGEQIWTAEIGQPWRNQRAGLTDGLLTPGTEITLEGHRSADPDQYVMKAERVIIAGKLYNLYPDRS
jgi:hypothetical protein